MRRPQCPINIVVAAVPFRFTRIPRMAGNSSLWLCCADTKLGGALRVRGFCFPEVTSLPIEPVIGSCFAHHHLKRTLFQISVPTISEKNSRWLHEWLHDGPILKLGHREAIRRKRPGMLSDAVIFLHGNTHTSLKLKNCCKSSSEKSGVTPKQHSFGTQTGLQTLIWNKVLFKQ
ncbi:hypothetical protein AVEN_73347-1 [Araneus ventricosus]|uniref:Uncharacterized protein n=1 Tax=Araneus ventricosus TaxID=182803 RepID=A0A4Y2NSE4_ARAVE|nr:hypothetical protein AVEN_73347-1 [Araneus ventricosus]